MVSEKSSSASLSSSPIVTPASIALIETKVRAEANEVSFDPAPKILIFTQPVSSAGLPSPNPITPLWIATQNGIATPPTSSTVASANESDTLKARTAI